MIAVPPPICCHYFAAPRHDYFTLMPTLSFSLILCQFSPP